MDERKPRCAVNEEPGVRRIELVLRVSGKAPVQPSMDNSEEAEGKRGPKPHCFIGMGDKPDDQGKERHMEQDESAAGRLGGHATQDEEQTPFALVHGIEFVGEERRTHDVEYEVCDSVHTERRLSFAEHGMTAPA